MAIVSEINRSSRRNPVYLQIAEILRKEIAENYEPDDVLPSQRSMVKRFNVSYVTVGNALQELVREGLLIRTMGSGTRVCDRSKIYNGLVAMLTSIHDPFYMSMFANAEKLLRQHRFRPVFFGCNVDYEEEKRAFEEMGHLNEAGLIIYSLFHHKLGSQIAELQRKGIPGVAIHRYIEGFDYVRLDHRMVGSLQAQCVASSHYRNILYIGLDNEGYGQLQAQGFIDGIRDTSLSSIKLTVRNIITGIGEQADQENKKNIAAIVHDVMKKQKLEMIVIFGDRYLSPVCDIIRAHGLTPGKDIALVGADNRNHQGFKYITTDHGLGRMGHDAARLLIERLTKQYEGPPRTFTILPQLVYHEGL